MIDTLGDTRFAHIEFLMLFLIKLFWNCLPLRKAAKVLPINFTEVYLKTICASGCVCRFNYYINT